MIGIPVILKALQVIGPITARLPEFKAFYDQVTSTFSKKTDQDTLKRAYQELLAENTGGHTRLQEMLRKAAAEEGEAPATGGDLTGRKVAGTDKDLS